MIKKIFLRALTITFFIFIFYALSWSDIKIGDEAPSFTLPSSQDRIVDYYKDYYGRYHLIITFFPAAFTPI